MATLSTMDSQHKQREAVHGSPQSPIWLAGLHTRAPSPINNEREEAKWPMQWSADYMSNLYEAEVSMLEEGTHPPASAKFSGPVHLTYWDNRVSASSILPHLASGRGATDARIVKNRYPRTPPFCKAASRHVSSAVCQAGSRVRCICTDAPSKLMPIMQTHLGTESISTAVFRARQCLYILCWFSSLRRRDQC